MPPVIAVTTTGIFCRTDCPASPHAAHIIRMADARRALFAGYRPCRRCRPAIPGGADGDRAGRRLPLLAAARSRRRRQPTEGIVRLGLVDTPLGTMLAAVSTRGLCLLEFTDRPMLETQLAILRRRLNASLEPGWTATHRTLVEQLDEYFAGRRRRFELPFDAPGTPFQARCWEALLSLDHGETVSYAQLAHRIGEPMAAHAVGRANGMNRLAIVIPCHRVIGHDGRLGGYGGGAWRKRRLLALESEASARAS